MSDLLLKGQKGIDFSSYRLNPPNAAVADGAKFMLRYSAGAASRPGHPSHQANTPKLITPAEYAGLDPFYVMLANSEWYEGRITEGAAAGTEDGSADFELWHACGYPQGYPVFCSWDQYPSATDFVGVAAYLRAHQAAMDKAAGGRYYVTDLYAGENGVRVMQNQGLAPIGWRTMAGSWNDYIPAAETHAAIVQTGNYWYGQQCDENVMARDLALPTGGDDMSQADIDAINAHTDQQITKVMVGLGQIQVGDGREKVPQGHPWNLYDMWKMLGTVKAATDTVEPTLAALAVAVSAIPTEPVDQVALERAVMDSIALALAGGVPVETIEQGVTNALAGASIPVNLSGHAGTPPVTP